MPAIIPMTVDELETELNKPLFILKMARGDKRTFGGGKKRALNARKTIHDIVMKYAIQQLNDEHTRKYWLRDEYWFKG